MYLDSVYNAIEGAIELNRQIVVKMDGLRQSVQRAYDDFCRLPVAWFEIGGLGRAMANVERRMSECRILGIPGTPIMSTEQITNMATSA